GFLRRFLGGPASLQFFVHHRAALSEVAHAYRHRLPCGRGPRQRLYGDFLRREFLVVAAILQHLVRGVGQRDIARVLVPFDLLRWLAQEVQERGHALVLFGLVAFHGPYRAAADEVVLQRHVRLVRHRR